MYIPSTNFNTIVVYQHLYQDSHCSTNCYTFSTLNEQTILGPALYLLCNVMLYYTGWNCISKSYFELKPRNKTEKLNFILGSMQYNPIILHKVCLFIFLIAWIQLFPILKFRLNVRMGFDLLIWEFSAFSEFSQIKPATSWFQARKHNARI